MRLSTDYSRVAVFEAKPGKVEYFKVGRTVMSEFQAGPFLYVIRFEPQDSHGETVAVVFRLVDIIADDEELIRLASQIKERDKPSGETQGEEPGEEWGMTLYDAQDILQKVIQESGYKLLKITGKYSLRIFSSVLNAVRNYVDKYHPKCLYFTSDEQERTDFYNKLIKRIITQEFPGASLELKPVSAGIEGFLVCLEE